MSTTTRPRPVILRDAEVCALLADGAAEVRRVVKPQPHECRNGDLTYRDRLIGSAMPERSWAACGPYEEAYEVCPFGAPGAVLWVKEGAYIARPNFGDPIDANIRDHRGRLRVIGYAASMGSEAVRCATDYGVSLIPSPRLPRWASRLTVSVAAVRVERTDGVWEWVGTFRRVDEGSQPRPLIPERSTPRP